jgi:hypothetical protein
MASHRSATLCLLGLALLMGCDDDGPSTDTDPASNDPCGLPGVQFDATMIVRGSTTTNALTAPFSGDVLFLGTDLFSFQQASVQRKFLVHIPNLNPATYDLSTTYMSYTEKTSDTDPSPRVWKATSGTLQVLSCSGGGKAVRTSVAGGGTGDEAVFEPVVASTNTATGKLFMNIGAHL